MKNKLILILSILSLNIFKNTQAFNVKDSVARIKNINIKETANNLKTRVQAIDKKAALKKIGIWSPAIFCTLVGAELAHNARVDYDKKIDSKDNHPKDFVKKANSDCETKENCAMTICITGFIISYLLHRKYSN